MLCIQLSSRAVFRPVALIVLCLGLMPADAQVTNAQQAGVVMGKYCATCHSKEVHTAGLVLDPAALRIPADAERWEKVIRKLRGKSMPPPGLPRPDAVTHDSLVAFLE